MNVKNPLMLIILDGWGINEDQKGNAVKLAKTPNLDMLFNNYPHTELKCSGKSVGLPDGVMGNSEVGHLNIGAGRIVYQDMLRIDNSISDKSFLKNSAFLDIIEKTKQNNGRLHLMGLVSDGAVHSHINHIFALIDIAEQNNIEVLVHAILDGRDTPPDSGKNYIKQLNDYLKKYDKARIATICGRFYAMDRDKRWERIEKAYNLYTEGKGIEENDPLEAVENSYNRDESDEFVKPVIIKNNKKNVLCDNDGVIFFNFRADRAREITKALTDNEFVEFKRNIVPSLSFVCMTKYDDSFELSVAFPPIKLNNNLGQIISKAGLKQLRIAETEKYAHVTYFFNSGEEEPFKNEDRVLIPSPREIETYDQKPEMSANAVTEKVVELIREKKYDLLILNFANMDMVGHTGVLEAAISACETVDNCIGKIINEIKSHNIISLITADHGNAEKMLDANGKIHTAHTTNPVPIILVDDYRKNIKLKNGILADIAPTILDILDVQKPSEMTGSSLIE